MALVLGTNCGFVTTAPTDDPAELNTTTEERSLSIKDTSPAGATKIVEIGWYANSATPEANFEIGVYDDDSVNSEPGTLLSGASLTNAKGTTQGWKRVTGLNISISENTVYWLAMQMDAVSGGTVNTDAKTSGGKIARKYSSYSLPSDWGTSSAKNDWLLSIYAITEGAATGTNCKINIGDAWKDVSEIKINIGDSWKAVTQVKQNIGDDWKDVF
jgi:hypothetical protein